MSSVLNLIKNLPTASNDDEANLASDVNYIRKSASLVNDALQKGSDIMQLANGDIIITEVKTMTYKYVWNEETNKFDRATSGSRSKKKRARELAKDNAYEFYNSKYNHVSYDKSRQKEIVKWLSSSKYAVAMQNNEGFYILGKLKGRLKDGRKIRLIDWLYEEGITNGTEILQYELQYNRDEDRLYLFDSAGGAQKHIFIVA